MSDQTVLSTEEALRAIGEEPSAGGMTTEQALATLEPPAEPAVTLKSQLAKTLAGSGQDDLRARLAETPVTPMPNATPGRPLGYGDHDTGEVGTGILPTLATAIGETALNAGTGAVGAFAQPWADAAYELRGGDRSSTTDPTGVGAGAPIPYSPPSPGADPWAPAPASEAVFRRPAAAPAEGTDMEAVLANVLRGTVGALPPVAALSGATNALGQATAESEAMGMEPNALARGVAGAHEAVGRGMEHFRDVGERQIPYLATGDPEARSELGGFGMEMAPWGMLGLRGAKRAPRIMEGPRAAAAAAEARALEAARGGAGVIPPAEPAPRVQLSEAPLDRAGPWGETARNLPVAERPAEPTAPPIRFRKPEPVAEAPTRPAGEIGPEPVAPVPTLEAPKLPASESAALAKTQRAAGEIESLGSMDPTIGTGAKGTAGAAKASSWLPTDAPPEVYEVAQKMMFNEPKPTVLGRLRQGWRKAKMFARPDAVIAEMERWGGSRQIERAGPTQTYKHEIGQAAVRTETLLRHGVLEGRERQHRVKTPFLDAIRDLEGIDPKNVATYATARRFKERYDPNALPTGVRPEASAETVRWYEQNHPEVARAAESMSEALTTAFNEAVDAGVFDPKAAKAIRDANPGFYTFIARVFDVPESRPSARPAGMSGLKVEKVKGGDQPVRDQMALLEDRMRAMLSAASRGNRLRSLVEWGERLEIPPDNPWFRVLSPKEAAKTGKFPNFTEFLEEFKQKNPDAFEGKLAAEGVDAAMEMYSQEYVKANAGKSRQTVTIRGEQKVVEFRDPDLRRVMEMGDHAEAGTLAKIIKVAMGPAAKVMRLTITQFNPEFQAGNLARDIRTSMIFTRRKGLSGMLRSVLDTTANHAKNIERLARKARDKKPSAEDVAYKSLGVQGFYSMDMAHRLGAYERLADPTPLGGKYYARHPQRVPKAVLDSLGEVSDAIETAPRQPEALAVVRKRMPDWKPGERIPYEVQVEAGTAGAEVTVPFKYGSPEAKIASSVYIFFNARMQGVAQMAEMARRNPKGLALGIGVTSVVPRLVLWALNHNEDWYKRRPKWRRESLNVGENFALPSNGPLDQPGIVAERTLNEMFADDPRGADEMARSILEDFLPMETTQSADVTDPKQLLNLMPSAIRPLVETAIDLNLWTGRPINPRAKVEGRSESPELVAHEYTSTLGKKLSKFLHDADVANLTAAEVDHLIRGYFGGAGRAATRALGQVGEREGADVPLLGRFTPRIKESRWVDEFFERRSEMTGAHDSGNLAKRSGETDRAQELLVPISVRRSVERISKRLKAISGEYSAADVEERKRLAEEADRLAQQGLRLMQRENAEVIR